MSMDPQIFVELIINILHFAALMAAIVVAAKKSKEYRALFVTYYVFALLALALEDVYWIAYDYIRPDERMPFAANEIACSAFLLMIGAAMATKVDKNLPGKTREFIFSFIYMGVNAALWIAWSGQWLENIIFAVPYVYYLYYLVRGLRSTKVINVVEEWLFIVINIIVFVMYGFELVTSESTTELLNNIGYVIIFALWLYILVKFIRLREQEDIGDKAVFLSFALLLWSMLVVYMSYGVFYSIALIFTIVAIPVTLNAVLISADTES